MEETLVRPFATQQECPRAPNRLPARREAAPAGTELGARGGSSRGRPVGLSSIAGSLFGALEPSRRRAARQQSGGAEGELGRSTARPGQPQHRLHMTDGTLTRAPVELLERLVHAT